METELTGSGEAVMEETGSSGRTGGCWRCGRSTCCLWVSKKFLTSTGSNAATQWHTDTNGDTSVKEQNSSSPTNWFLAGGNHKQEVVCVVRNGRRHSVFIPCVKDPDLFHVVSKVYIRAQVFQLVACSRDWFLSAGWWKMDGFLSNLYHIDFSAVFYMHAGGHSTAKCILNTHHNKIACRISKFTNASIVLSRDLCKSWLLRNSCGDLSPVYIHSFVHVEVLLTFCIHLVKPEYVWSPMQKRKGLEGWNKPVVWQPRLWC